MKIKSILSSIVQNKAYHVWGYVALGAVGVQGIATPTEVFQAMGVATVALSSWQITKIGWQKYLTNKSESIKAITYDNNKVQTIDPSTGEVIYVSETDKVKPVDIQYTKYLTNCYDMGMHYLNGVGVSKDYSKAFDSFYEGAKQGSLECAIELGKFYESGKFKSRNDFLARYWYEIAAYGGVPEAYYLLARWYIEHEKTGTSYLRIVFFLDLACSKGYDKAINLRTSLQSNNQYTNQAIENIIGKNKKVLMYDFANKKELKKFIFKGGTSDPKDIIRSYKILGFNVPSNLEMPELTKNQIKKAYHKRVALLHPDKNISSEVDLDKMRILQESYLLLLKLNS